jgi:DNA polymerase elongation subunit (family B)
MSYVDSVYDRQRDKILVAERLNGERVLSEYDAEHVFYYSHPAGGHTSIFGDSCKKFSTNNSQKFRRELAKIKSPISNKKPVRIFESDINPVFRFLANQFRNVEAPVLNVCFFDIEVDFDPKRGFAPTTDPFNAVTAISLYSTYEQKLISLVLCPKTVELEEGLRICGEFQDTILFDDEAELLRSFLELIEPVDVLSGWNSTGFDIPYLVNRITRVLSKDATRALCLWNQTPRTREYMKFKRELITYDLVGRVHLDYLELYQKHNPQQLHSYRLDFVAEVEVGENKTAYEGTLDDLYKKDFKRFIEYNRQDTMLLVKIDEKKKFVELANQVAHSNCVTLKTTMGSVSLVEQAIINEMHDLGFVVPERRAKLEERDEPAARFDDDDDDDSGDDYGEDDGRTPVVGAYVADPKKGLHSEIGCVDINSLYPSAIRALNMSPETILGQVRLDETMSYIAQKVRELGKKKRAEAWEGIFASLEFDHMHAHDGAPVTVDFEDGTSKTMSGRQLYEYIFNPKNNVCITANGTIFRTDKDGIIPMLLAKWYSQRKEMQANERFYTNLYEGVEISAELEAAINSSTDTVETKTNLKYLVEDVENDNTSAIRWLIQEHSLTIVDRMIVASTAEIKSQFKYWVDFWNQRQQARKILLNSLYGALLNEGLRFYDERLGQSVTLTGRSIVRHMNAKINEVITGEYDYKGAAIFYADTDSSYFSAYEVLKDDPRFKDYNWSRDNIIALYDGIADEVNASFPEFMNRTFNTTIKRGSVIKAGRELVASRALFIKKKKYAVLMYEKEGTRYDKDGKIGKLKPMGLDLKRADTPKMMQIFLEKILIDLLSGVEQENLFEQIRTFRREFKKLNGWEKGTPKKVSALTDYTERFERGRNMGLEEAMRLKAGEKAKVNLPGHVRAAMNWNSMCESRQDRYSMRINDGSKIVVCYLKSNMMKMDSVAYPIDEPHIPMWFKELEFDHEKMENTIIDKKIKNLLGVLKWDLDQTRELAGDDIFVFS